MRRVRTAHGGGISVLICIYEEVIHLKGRQPCQKLFFLPSEKGSTLKGKNLLSGVCSKRIESPPPPPTHPPESKFFPSREDHFSERVCCAGRQIGSPKNISLVKLAANLPNVFSPLKCFYSQTCVKQTPKDKKWLLKTGACLLQVNLCLFDFLGL